MNNTFKKIFVCLAVTISAFFIGAGNSKALTCKYRLDAEKDPNEMGKINNNEQFRKILYHIIHNSLDNPSDNDRIDSIYITVYDDDHLIISMTGTFPNTVSLFGADSGEQKTIEGIVPDEVKDKFKSTKCPDVIGVAFGETSSNLKIDFGLIFPVYSFAPISMAGVVQAEDFDDEEGNVVYAISSRNDFWLKNEASKYIHSYLYYFVSEEAKERSNQKKEFDKCVSDKEDSINENTEEVRQILKNNESALNKLPKELTKETASDYQDVYMKNAPYFKNCTSGSSSEIFNKINNDKKTLITFKDNLNEIATCAGKNTNNKYNWEYFFTMFVSGLTPTDLDRLLINLDIIKSESDIKLICDAQVEQHDVETSRQDLASDCYRLLDSTLVKERESCIRNAYKEAFQELDCNNFATLNINNYEGSEFERTLIRQSGCGTNYNCLKNYCENLNSDYFSNEVVDSITNWESSIQEKYEALISPAYYQMIDMESSDNKTKICDLLKNSLGDYIKGALSLIQIAGIAITLILTIMDGIKAFTSFKDDENRKFFNNLKIRLISIALLIIIPIVINWILSMFQDVCKLN